jgi:hypothetical protein
MPQPYTIRLFVPDGEPDSFKKIDKMNWSGIGLEISRSSWKKHRNEKELEQAGIYILFGYEEESDLPTLYIGQGDGVKSRIDKHEKDSKKAFWDRVLVFVSSNNGLNRAHITWLEWALIIRAQEMNRCNLNNDQIPKEPVLTDSEKADTKIFLNEILSILPLVEVRVFEEAQKITVNQTTKRNTEDTIVVPAQEEGFKDAFLGRHCWYAIRIAAGRLQNIKYIATYQVAPLSAITYVAEVESIEPYGDGGKYKLNVKAPQKIQAIPLGNAPKGAMQAPRYASYEKLLQAKDLVDLFQ